MTTAIYPCSSRGRPPPVTLNLKKLKGEKKLSTFIEHHSCHDCVVWKAGGGLSNGKVNSKPKLYLLRKQQIQQTKLETRNSD